MVTRASTLTKDHWFAKLSPNKKAAYIKKHPNSIYAKHASHRVSQKALTQDRALHEAHKQRRADLHSALEEHKKAARKYAHTENPTFDFHRRDLHKAIKEQHAELLKSARMLQMHRRRHGITGKPKLKVPTETQLLRKLKLHKKMAANKAHLKRKGTQ